MILYNEEIAIKDDTKSIRRYYKISNTKLIFSNKILISTDLEVYKSRVWLFWILSSNAYYKFSNIIILKNKLVLKFEDLVT